MIEGPNKLKIAPNGEQNKKYCVCAKSNDNLFYVQCEDGCEWYHPECVGFKTLLFKNNDKTIKFLCPFCSESTKQQMKKDADPEGGRLMHIKSEKNNFL